MERAQKGEITGIFPCFHFWNCLPAVLCLRVIKAKDDYHKKYKKTGSRKRQVAETDWLVVSYALSTVYTTSMQTASVVLAKVFDYGRPC